MDSIVQTQVSQHIIRITYNQAAGDKPISKNAELPLSRRWNFFRGAPNTAYFINCNASSLTEEEVRFFNENLDVHEGPRNFTVKHTIAI